MREHVHLQETTQTLKPACGTPRPTAGSFPSADEYGTGTRPNEGLRPLGRQSRGTNEFTTYARGTKGPSVRWEEENKQNTNQQIPVAAGICENGNLIRLILRQNSRGEYDYWVYIQ